MARGGSPPRRIPPAPPADVEEPRSARPVAPGTWPRTATGPPRPARAPSALARSDDDRRRARGQPRGRRLVGDSRAPGAHLRTRRRGAATPRVIPVSADEIARTLAWEPRLLDFASTPLREVVAEFNRGNEVQLVIADPSLSEMPIVASFRSDNVDGFVRLLELTSGVRAERNGHQVRLQRAK